MKGGLPHRIGTESTFLVYLDKMHVVNLPNKVRSNPPSGGRLRGTADILARGLSNSHTVKVTVTDDVACQLPD